MECLWEKSNQPSSSSSASSSSSSSSSSSIFRFVIVRLTELYVFLSVVHLGLTNSEGQVGVMVEEGYKE
ncbi:hypothetical protein E2C01_089958 [Portunus trituberculatus]|uniref:Uncharacterized protein n=1 Tax=Portunus trituberculatus TaxID=210409 RepID=A0A5B7JR00_PORTR|nr:hypothetical protein [Portunus trituberculatus]